MTRLGYAITTTAAASLLGVLSVVSFAPKLIWNASASTPIGLYAIEPDRSPDVPPIWSPSARPSRWRASSPKAAISLAAYH